MVVEGYLSGTPAITTDWGAFPETVQQGVTGFRCRSFRDIVNAINNIDQIKPKDCRDWAMKNYTDEVVHDRLDQYLQNLKTTEFYKV